MRQLTKKLPHNHIGGSKFPVGWCELHHNSLSYHQAKNRKCISKGCHHFKKNKLHPIWKQREKKKEMKKINKLKRRKRNG